jgi:hypothetical protein
MLGKSRRQKFRDAVPFIVVIYTKALWYENIKIKPQKNLNLAILLMLLDIR